MDNNRVALLQDMARLRAIISSEKTTPEQKEAAKKEKRDVTPPGFGRIAAQTAKQVIHQKIREAEKAKVLAHFRGDIFSSGFRPSPE